LLFLLDNLSSFYFLFLHGSFVTKLTVVIFRSVAEPDEICILREINLFPKKAPAPSNPHRSDSGKKKSIDINNMLYSKELVTQYMEVQ